MNTKKILIIITLIAVIFSSIIAVVIFTFISNYDSPEDGFAIARNEERRSKVRAYADAIEQYVKVNGREDFINEDRYLSLPACDRPAEEIDIANHVVYEKLIPDFMASHLRDPQQDPESELTGFTLCDDGSFYVQAPKTEGDNYIIQTDIRLYNID